MQKQITLNGKTVEYDLQRKKVKNINLRIKPDGKISLSASPRVSQKVLEDFLRSKADFILNALAKYEALAQNAPKASANVCGEVIKVLGCDMRLKVLEGVKNTAECDGERVTLTVTDVNDTSLKRKTLDAWLTALCRDTVRSMCDKVYPTFKKYGVKYPQIKYRHMKTMWGNCRAEGGIVTFNYALVHVPLSCIEYVVVHEFTHFLEANHSKRFYSHLSAFMPDWERRRQVLRQYGVYTR